jgi:hypothetical protein
VILGRVHVAVRQLDGLHDPEERRYALGPQLLAAHQEQLHRVIGERSRQRQAGRGNVGGCDVADDDALARLAVSHSNCPATRTSGT